MQLITGYELDRLFKWKQGKAERMAKLGLIPHYLLPDGKTIRFNESEILAALKHIQSSTQSKAPLEGLYDQV